MSLARKVAAIRPSAKPGLRAGCSRLNRTATAGGHAAAGKFIRESVSLVVAARPSAGRSPLRAHGAKCSSPRPCQTRMSSGTLRFVKDKITSHSNTKMSRPSRFSGWLGLDCKSNGANPDA